MANGFKYFNRDLSWLSYDSLVLESAKAKDISIGESINFVSFHTSNIDEFYSVRVAEYRKKTIEGVSSDMEEVSNPEAILKKINANVSHQKAAATEIISKIICRRLVDEGIYLHFGNMPTHPQHIDYMHNYFEHEVIPNIQPILLGVGTLVFLRDNRPYFAVKLKPRPKGKKKTAGGVIYSLVKLPIVELPRFVVLPDIDDGLTHIVFVDDIIRCNLQELYPGYDVEGAWAVKISRDADLQIRDDFNGDIAEEIRDNLVLRKTGVPAGFYHDALMPLDVLKCLRENFNFNESHLVVCGQYLNLHDLAKLPIGSNTAHNGILFPIVPKQLQVSASLFSTIEKGDILLHYPYQSFDYVIRLINEAANDPSVSEIRITQYRVATNSAVVNSLIAAAAANKKVTVFVELKARFDEINNLELSERMRAAGIRIIYSIQTLKVHAKVALIIRENKSLAYISTGNFNEKTARVYTDHGLFTADTDIIEDLRRVFDFLENLNGEQIRLVVDQLSKQIKKLLVTQINLSNKVFELINNEVEIAKKGGDAQISLKMNGLQYRPLIDALYRASMAGVKINIIIRGICCLVPNQPYSKNIRLIRLVDNYLEHGRVWAFGPYGDRGVYITSSDWLNRNIRRRIEVAVPIANATLRRELMQIIELQLSDNTKACLIDEKLNNIPIRTKGKKIRAQHDIYTLIQQWQQIEKADF